MVGPTRPALVLDRAAVRAVAKTQAAAEAQGSEAPEVAAEAWLVAREPAARVDGLCPIRGRRVTASSRWARATRATRLSAIAALPREEAFNFQ